MLTLISFPSNFLASASTTSGGVFTDLLPLVALVAGLALGIYFAGWVIRKVSRRGGGRRRRRR